jgi:riboflavin transporter
MGEGSDLSVFLSLWIQFFFIKIRRRGISVLNRKVSLQVQIGIAMLGAISYIVQLFDFPLPFFPTFLMLDFSEIVAAIGAVIYGPIAGVAIVALKNVFHILFEGSETGIPIGPIANFFAGSILVYIVGVASSRSTNLQAILKGWVLGIVTMSVVMAIANYFIIFPAYAYLINWQVSSAEKFNLILYGILPFNLLKGSLLGFIFVPLYLKVTSIQYVKARLN